MSDLLKAKAEVLTFAAAHPCATPRIDERETQNGTTSYFQVEVAFTESMVEALKAISHAKVVVRVEAYEGAYVGSGNSGNSNSGNALLKLLGG
jgi:hypothetical protein